MFNEGYSGDVDLAAGAIRLTRQLASAADDPEVDGDVPRRDAVAAHLHERAGDLALAAHLYATAARHAPNLAEREHQVRQAARLNQLLRDDR